MADRPGFHQEIPIAPLAALRDRGGDPAQHEKADRCLAGHLLPDARADHRLAQVAAPKQHEAMRRRFVAVDARSQARDAMHGELEVDTRSTLQGRVTPGRLQREGERVEGGRLAAKRQGRASLTDGLRQRRAWSGPTLQVHGRAGSRDGLRQRR